MSSATATKTTKPVKKNLKKKPIKEEEETPEVEVKTVKKIRKVKKPEVEPEAEPVEEKKEVKKPKKQSKKAETSESEEEKPAKRTRKKKTDGETEEKVSKKKPLNNKPTLSDLCGLNLSIPKVKAIISDLCINKEVTSALKDIRSNRVYDETKNENNKRVYTLSYSSLSEETREFLEECHLNMLETQRLDFSKQKIREMTEEKRASYLEARKQAMAEFQEEQMSGHLFQEHDFDLTAFNLRWEANFYKSMETVNWKSLKDEELYKYCSNLMSKVKVRFNSEAKVFITLFIENIVKQLVTNGTVNAALENKKIIKIEHALNTKSPGFTENFALFPFIANLTSYKKHLVAKPAEDATEEENTDKKVQFKHYVNELCRTVRMELTRSDNSVAEHSASIYNHISVSKEFKDFCSEIIIDLIMMFGEVLKAEIATRKVKTINYTVIKTLINVTHILLGLESHMDDTIGFIQRGYKNHNEYLRERATKRAEKGEAESDKDEE